MTSDKVDLCSFFLVVNTDCHYSFDSKHFLHSANISEKHLLESPK